MLERLATLVERDVAGIRSSPSGPVAHLIRTSMATGSALDKALVATSRLAQASQLDGPRRTARRQRRLVRHRAREHGRPGALARDHAHQRRARLRLGFSTRARRLRRRAELSASDIDDLVDLITEVTAQRAGH